jgi:hypothetical protein
MKTWNTEMATVSSTQKLVFFNTEGIECLCFEAFVRKTSGRNWGRVSSDERTLLTSLQICRHQAYGC